VDVLQAASYLSQKPLIELPPVVENLLGTIFAGLGRVMNDLLRGQRQVGFSAQLVIPPQPDVAESAHSSSESRATS